MLQNQYRHTTRNSILKPRLYIKVYKNLEPSLTNLTIKVETFEPLEKVFSRNWPFYADEIIILALDLFAVTAISFLL